MNVFIIGDERFDFSLLYIVQKDYVYQNAYYDRCCQYTDQNVHLFLLVDEILL